MKDVFTLGERVRHQRKALGLSAKTVARAAGMSASYLSQVEHGTKDAPSLSVVRRLADALQCTVQELVGDPPPLEFSRALPLPLAALVQDYGLSAEMTALLAQVHCEGRQPVSYDDWLIVLIAMRRACHLSALPARLESAPGRHAAGGGS